MKRPTEDPLQPIAMPNLGSWPLDCQPLALAEWQAEAMRHPSPYVPTRTSAPQPGQASPVERAGVRGGGSGYLAAAVRRHLTPCCLGLGLPGNRLSTSRGVSSSLATP